MHAIVQHSGVLHARARHSYLTLVAACESFWSAFASRPPALAPCLCYECMRVCAENQYTPLLLLLRQQQLAAVRILCFAHCWKGSGASRSMHAALYVCLLRLCTFWVCTKPLQ
jgi:hypothetical protein